MSFHKSSITSKHFAKFIKSGMKIDMNERTKALLKPGSIIKFTRSDFEHVVAGREYVVVRFDTKTVFKDGYDGKKTEGYDLTLVELAKFRAGELENTISVQFPKDEEKVFVRVGEVVLPGNDRVDGGDKATMVR